MQKERERNISVWLPLTWPPLGTWPTTQACALTRNRTGDLLLHSPEFNPLSHTSHGTIDLFFQIYNYTALAAVAQWTEHRNGN